MTRAEVIELYKGWNRDQQYLYRERIAIAREGNNIPDGAETPIEIIEIAVRQAEACQKSRN